MQTGVSGESCDSCLFTDARGLMSPGAKSFCATHCQECLVPSRVQMVFCGSSCKYFSRANQAKKHGPASTFLATASDGTGATHQSKVTFDAFDLFIARAKPDVFMWENVDAVLDQSPDSGSSSGSSNLDYVLQQWEDQYAVQPFLTDAAAWGTSISAAFVCAGPVTCARKNLSNE